MDQHIEILLDQYKQLVPSLRQLEKYVLNELYHIVDELHILPDLITSRIKTEKSLKGKLELKGYKYNSITDVTDLLGARVVSFYSDDIDKIAAIVAQKFEIDWDNSIDKRKSLQIDQFGYMSLHYICHLPKELYFDEKMPELNKIPFEIQMRTTLQHAWASINHDTGYKNDIEVPSEYVRSLNRLAGLLELADEEFQRIKNSLNDYRRRVKRVIASGDFNSVDLNGDSFKAYLESGVFDALNKRIASINNMEIEQVKYHNLLACFRCIGCLTLGDVEEIRKKYSEDAYQLCLRQLAGSDIDIISASVGPETLCAVACIEEGKGEETLIKVVSSSLGEGPLAMRRVKRLYSLAVDIGLAKGEK